ncbi:MAG: hypothetical protein K6F76_04405 [Clostridiales bacterium]|nr:hypothetical protein [Clostridiales bacterium]
MKEYISPTLNEALLAENDTLTASGENTTSNSESQPAKRSLDNNLSFFDLDK